MTPCPANHYCPSGGYIPLPCPPGTHTSTTAPVPPVAPAPPGPPSGGLPFSRCCDVQTLGSPKAVLLGYPSGPFCFLGINYLLVLSLLVGAECPENAYCPEGTVKPRRCPDGKYIPFRGATSETSCVPCPGGYYCTEKDGMKKCQAGHYCIGGAETATQHQARAGWYAPEGSSAEFQCPAGTTSAQGQGECTDCPAGKLCDAMGLGAAKGPCPQGYYCPAGAPKKLPCPRGTYGAREGLTSETECTPCEAGKYCFDKGLARPSGACRAGYYCAGSSKYPAPETNEEGGYICPTGHYCTEGIASPEPCPEKTYGPTLGAAAEDDCLPCPAGSTSDTHIALVEPHATDRESRDPQGTACPEGHYCPRGSGEPKKCPGVRDSRAQANGVLPSFHTNCWFVFSSSNLPLFLYGTYQDAQASSSCKECPAGYACPAGSTEGAVDKNVCPKGHFCPAGTIAKVQYPCPPGFYNPKTGGKSLDACHPCPAGKFCDRVGLGEPTGECAEGYYCSGGAYHKKGYTNTLTDITSFTATPARSRFPFTSSSTRDLDHPQRLRNLQRKKRQETSLRNRFFKKFFPLAQTGSSSPDRSSSSFSAPIDMTCTVEDLRTVDSISTLRYKKIESGEACMSLCRENDLCQYFTWLPATHVCELVADVFTTSACTAEEGGCLSGPKSCSTDCYLENVDFPSGTLLTHYEDVETPQACQSRCALHLTCAVFIYNKQDKTCLLKSTDALSKRVQAPTADYVAGPKQFCEFGGSLTTSKGRSIGRKREQRSGFGSDVYTPDVGGGRRERGKGAAASMQMNSTQQTPYGSPHYAETRASVLKGIYAPLALHIPSLVHLESIAKATSRMPKRTPAKRASSVPKVRFQQHWDTPGDGGRRQESQPLTGSYRKQRLNLRNSSQHVHSSNRPPLPSRRSRPYNSRYSLFRYTKSACNP
ncbi:pan domain-containing protein [Cystoisospora suis]|uniref:Pan domain-containing protein n=1 Tax=Cystoisospora suis TaxID=483139 RepID=A0A2C6KJN3_9APIC|nr:pan domain-containing protein [Cystoisospora suis]